MDKKAEDTAWIAAIRPLQRVAIRVGRAGVARDTYEIEQVDRVTPTGRIVTERGFTFNKDGSEYGRSSMSTWRRMVPLTPELETEITAAKEREKHLHFLKQTNYDKEFDSAALKRLYDAVCAEMRKAKGGK